MITVRELKEWLAPLGDDDLIAIDDGGLTLESKLGWIEVGGWPEPDEDETGDERLRSN